MDKQKLCTELMVANKIHETDDTVSLVFEIPPEHQAKFKYRAGQFVTLFLDVKGEEIRRSYSLASSPDYDQDFKISVKLVPGGKGSTHLFRNVKAGDMLWVTPPAGFFILPSEMKNANPSARQFAFYAAGSGITPVISLMKSALKKSSETRCVLFYQNRVESNVIFKNELSTLAKEFGARLHVEHVMSKPSPSWRGLSGRLTSTMIRQTLSHVKMANNETYHYICGPEGFMHTALTTLQDELHFQKDKIIKESFASGTSGHSTLTSSASGTDLNTSGSTAAEAVSSGIGSATTHSGASSGGSVAAKTSSGAYKVPDEAILIGDKASLSQPEKIEAIVDGETHFVDYKEGQSVLDCLLDANLSPPYSCLDGACMACIAKVKSGLVYQTDLGILSEDNVEVSECLTCQAKPASKNVKIHYESF